MGETEEKKIEDESQINLWYLQIKSTVNEKKENIKKLFLGDTAASINQVKPTMNTIFVVNDFMNGSYIGRIFRILDLYGSILGTNFGTFTRIRSE